MQHFLWFRHHFLFYLSAAAMFSFLPNTFLFLDFFSLYLLVWFCASRFFFLSIGLAVFRLWFTSLPSALVQNWNHREISNTFHASDLLNRTDHAQGWRSWGIAEARRKGSYTRENSTGRQKSGIPNGLGCLESTCLFLRYEGTVNECTWRYQINNVYIAIAEFLSDFNLYRAWVHEILTLLLKKKKNSSFFAFCFSLLWIEFSASHEA